MLVPHVADDDGRLGRVPGDLLGEAWNRLLPGLFRRVSAMWSARGFALRNRPRQLVAAKNDATEQYGREAQKGPEQSMEHRAKRRIRVELSAGMSGCVVSPFQEPVESKFADPSSEDAC